jgi:CheY-like chemotaxis protein
MNSGIPYSILVVDDDADDRFLIDDAFNEIGQATVVKKFIEGKALLHYLDSIDPSMYPSLIVLDNTLPELEATDLLSILKSHPSYKSIAVVVYTTSLPPRKKRQLLSMGAYACFEKGNTVGEIVDMVKEFCRIAEEKLKDQPLP